MHESDLKIIQLKIFNILHLPRLIRLIKQEQLLKLNYLTG